VTQLPVSKGAWQMRVAASTPFELVGLHTTQPLISYDEWRADHDALRAAVAAIHGPLVVAGDFNATLDHSTFRDGTTGCADAAERTGEGLVATWPTRFPRWFGVQIDHVLVTGGITAETMEVHDIPGSDHRALVTRLRLPA